MSPSRISAWKGGAAESGGAILNHGSLTLDRVTARSNSTTGSGNGGAIFNDGTLTISHGSFTGNKAHRGGAVYNMGTFTATDSTFTDNTAEVGGGIVNNYFIGIPNSGTLTLSNDTLTGNSAKVGGALWHSGNSPALITKSTISGNRVTNGWAPGIYVAPKSTLSIADTVVVNNNKIEGTLVDKGGNKITAP